MLKTVLSLAVVLILFAGLFIGIKLVQQQNIFKSHASNDPISFSGTSVHSDATGYVYTTAASVMVTITSPYGAPPSVLGASIGPIAQTTSTNFIDNILLLLHLKQPVVQTREVELDVQPAPLPSPKLDSAGELLRAVRSKAPVASPVFPSPSIPTPSFIPKPSLSPTPTLSPAPTVIPTPTPSPSITPSASGPEGTLGYRFSESLADLQTMQFLAYTQHPLSFQYTFQNTQNGSKFLFVQFKSTTGELSQIYSRPIELRINSSPSPSVSASPTPSPSLSPSSSTTSSPAVTSSPTPSPSLSH